ncbi:endoglucanase [Abditibacteriota bacterium]|nr:endoglucanase [Abditibacteriota bacterium]
MRHITWFSSARFLFGAATITSALFDASGYAQAQTPPTPASFGVNMAGADFGGDKLPGVVYKDYTWPSGKELDYFRDKGCRLIRLPMLWERLQPQLGAALDEGKMQELEGVLHDCADHHIGVLLDCHSYARYRGQIIGTEGVSVENFADFWGQLATRLAKQPAMWAFGLMNEPHDMGDGARWPRAAQAATDAIRATGAKQWVFVGGDGWSGAHSWRQNNENLDIHDAQDRIVYEAHQYFDADNSGSYKHSYDEDKTTADIGSQRLAPFAAWLREKKRRGFIGEFGAPNNDRRWHVVLQDFVDAMHKEGVGGTYWAGGAWWGDYPLTIEPMDDFQTDRPAMKILAPLFDGATKP